MELVVKQLWQQYVLKRICIQLPIQRMVHVKNLFGYASWAFPSEIQASTLNRTIPLCDTSELFSKSAA